MVALVAADTGEHAREAAKKVKQNLEVLPAYMTFPEAVMPNAIQLHESMPNFYMEQPVFKGEDTAELFETAPVVAEGSFHSQHEPHLPIEPDVVQAYWGTDGMMTIQCKCQNLSENSEGYRRRPAASPRRTSACMLNCVGGSFGYTIASNTFALVATAVQNLDMPCTLTLSYDEFNHTTGKRSATFSNGRIACDEDGKIIAAEYDVALDHGAYGLVAHLHQPRLGRLPRLQHPQLQGAGPRRLLQPRLQHGLPRLRRPRRSTPPPRRSSTWRAEKAGIDPWEFRYKNAARPGDLTINSRPYHDYVYPTLLEMAKPIYDQYKAEAEAAKAEGRHVGVGMSMGGFIITIGMFDSAEVALELNADGTITHFNTWEDMGQGGDIGTLTHTVKALEPLGIKPEQVRAGHERQQDLPRHQPGRSQPLALHGRQRHHRRGQQAHGRHAQGGRHLSHLRRDGGRRHPHQVRRPLRPVQHRAASGTRSQHRRRREEPHLHVRRQRGPGRGGRQHRQDPGAAVHLGRRRGRGRQHALGRRPGLRRPLPLHRLRPQRGLRRAGQARQHGRLRHPHRST